MNFLQKHVLPILKNILNFFVSAPENYDQKTLRNKNIDLAIALAPTVIAGVIAFELRAVLLLTVCVASAILAELVWCLIFKKANTVGDLSAGITGLTLGLCLSSAIPLWLAALASFFAIIVIKQLLFAKLNVWVNPVVATRVVLLVAFFSLMSRFYMPFGNILVDGPTAPGKIALNSLLFGGYAGCIGEVFPLLSLLGGLYLILRKVISSVIPFSYILTVFAFTFALTGSLQSALYGILGGGVMFAAFFIATDRTASPKNLWSKVIFGAGCGILTVVFGRYVCALAGTACAILVMNLLSPALNKLTAPKSL